MFPFLSLLKNMTRGLYYKNITIVNYTSRVLRITIVSDALSYGITYSCLSGDSRGAIYAPRVINYSPKEC